VKKHRLEESKTKWCKKRRYQVSGDNACDADPRSLAPEHDEVQLSDAAVDGQLSLEANGSGTVQSSDVIDDKQQKRHRALAAEAVVKYLTPYYNSSRIVSKVALSLGLFSTLFDFLCCRLKVERVKPLRLSSST
jgi:hypothetical protein